MKQGTEEIPGKNPGVSTPQSPFSLQESCISGDHFRSHALKYEKPNDCELATSNYKSWVNSLIEHLDPVCKQVILNWWSFDLLSDVYNCGASHTKLFGPDVDHTRREHCIHAAFVSRQVADRALINLTDYERTVLQLVMLLHDPHRFGSHALDRVIASIPGAPPIGDWGWGHDFHEYHGAQELYRDKDLREILGEYWPDVRAVLCLPDTRDPNDPSRIRDFGPANPVLPEGHREPLPKDRIHLLYRLKDEIDRMSYMELDFRRSGFDPRLVRGLLGLLQNYQEHMVTFGSNLAVVIPERPRDSTARDKGGHPHELLASARNFWREQVATHAGSSLVDLVLEEAMWKTLKRHFENRMDTEGCYKYARNIALEGSYQKLFGTSVLEILGAPRANQETLGLEDLYAPLVTLSRDDLRSSNGPSILDYVSPQQSEALCGVPRADMTVLEHALRKELRNHGLDDRIFVVLSNDFEKILEYKCVESPHDVEAGAFLKRITETSDNKLTASLKDYVVYAVRSSPQSEKLIVAMPALDESGACRNLRPAQEVVRAFFRKRKLLKDSSTLETKYNHRAFCEPLTPEIFRPEVQERQAKFKPAWVIRGGCGLDIPWAR